MASLDDVIKENTELKQKIVELEETLKKYTNGERHQRYYDAHKDEVKTRAKFSKRIIFESIFLFLHP